MKVIEATTGRSHTWRAACNGFAQLVQVAEGLEDEQIGAGFSTGPDLLGEGLAGLLGLDAAKGRQAHAQRADIAGDAARRGRRRMTARRASSTPRAVDLANLVFQAVQGQLEAVGAKGVGLDDLGAGFDVQRGGYRRPEPAGCRLSWSKHWSKPKPRALSMGAHGAIAEERRRGKLQAREEGGRGHNNQIR